MLFGELIDLPAGYYSLRNHEARFVEGKIYRVMIGRSNQMRVVMEENVIRVQESDGRISTISRSSFWEALMRTPPHLRMVTDEEANPVRISNTARYFQPDDPYVCIRRMMRCFLVEQCLTLRETHKHNQKYSMSFMAHLQKAYDLTGIEPDGSVFSSARKLKEWDLNHRHQVDVALDPIWLVVRDLMDPVLSWAQKLTQNYLHHVHQIDMAGNSFILRRGPDHRALLWEMNKAIQPIED